MRSNIKYVMPLVLLSLAACQSMPTPIEVTAKPVELNIIQPVDPQPVDMLKVNAKVLTKENVDAFIKQAQKDLGTDNPVFVALSTRDYEALSLNIQELKRYIVQQQRIIAYYKKATAAHDVTTAAVPPAQ
jgi:hypothetical protein